MRKLRGERDDPVMSRRVSQLDTRKSDLEKQISDLKTEKTSLESKQSAIQAEIDKSINLDQIKDYAEKKLHMIYPKDSDVLLYQRDSDDYFRQYESVD